MYPTLSQASALQTCAIALTVLFLILLCRQAIGRLNRTGHPLAGLLRVLCNWIIPTLAVYIIVVIALHQPRQATPVKLLETILGIELIWISLSFLKVLLFSRASDATWRSKVPELLLDLIRFTMVVVGSCLVIATVWQRDLGGFLATLGVGSLVLGFALQDTLGNLMAGIAILFERSFGVGDWIKVGDTIGEIIEMNWRAMRLRTRNFDMVIVPNSVLSKERIRNFSRPTRVQGADMEISFSYNDPPNKVKHILAKIAHVTPGVLAQPAPIIRTKSFNDSSISYQALLFIDDYEWILDIEEHFRTQVWYAARRNGLTIPFPIVTVHKTEMPQPVVKDALADVHTTLANVPLFTSLDSTELDNLTRDAVVQAFAKGEWLVRQGEEGDALYVIRTGRALVTVSDQSGSMQQVAELRAGELFGEMALLTGEQRTASVQALEDLEVIIIYKEAMEGLLSIRPALAEELASTMEARRQDLIRALDNQQALTSSGADPKRESVFLVEKIRRFFRI